MTIQEASVKYKRVLIVIFILFYIYYKTKLIIKNERGIGKIWYILK